MNAFLEAIAWLADAANWSGPGSIPERLVQHLVLSVVVLVIAAVIALPIGAFIGHTGRGKAIAIGVSGGLRALPTLGLLSIVGLWIGIGVGAPVIALVVLALPPLLAGAYAGFESVSRTTIDAARAMGMTGWQLAGRVELPLGLPILVGGIRSATLQIIATATLAAYLSDVGLGRFIFLGLRTASYDEILGGAILVIVLALVIDGLFALLQRLVVPAGVRETRGMRARNRTHTNVGSPTDEGNRT
ncbi:ABC transporter permease [Agromyces archimandritae]|uniref:ABC transporter permease subunit n=1 Tax=Agromyces archimandritae TaxID=2781962 RepID=A0A975FLY1_9MICO|nr:ABC transporter permease subunit [Agromyces archimandritae]QTX04890.1 ABC transporter permease subunit [Agromyces archimandritae]